MENKKQLAVTDHSATEEYPVRSHDLLIGGHVKTVEFKYGIPTVLDFAVGAKFMGKDGFTVTDTDGLDVDMPAVATDNVSAQLAKDECVAKFSELSFSALKLRAAQQVDGEVFLEAEEDAREDIISFLIGEEDVQEPENIDGEKDLIEDEDEEKTEPDSDDTEEETGSDDINVRLNNIIDHFGGKAFAENGKTDDDIAILAILDGEEKNIVVGTFLQLEEAMLKGVSAEDFNKPQEAE